MKFLILNITPYKEKDAIITAFNSEEVITFNARGILSPTSKNVVLNNPLILMDLTFSESKSKYVSLKGTNVILSPYGLNDSLEKLCVISIIQECLSKMLQEEELPQIFDETIEVITALKNGEVNPLQILISFLASILKIAGSTFEINKCVYCETRKDLVTFSFEDGGYVCRDCYSGDSTIKFTPKQMLLIRQLFSNRKYNQNKEELTNKDAYAILDELIQYINDGIGVKIKTYNLLKN